MPTMSLFWWIFSSSVIHWSNTARYPLPMTAYKSGGSSLLFLISLNLYFLHFCKICHLTLQLRTMVLHLCNNQWNTVTNRMGRDSIHQGWIFAWELILHMDSSSANIFIWWWLLFPYASFVTARHGIMYLDNKGSHIWKATVIIEMVLSLGTRKLSQRTISKSKKQPLSFYILILPVCMPYHHSINRLNKMIPSMHPTLW